MVQGQTRRKSVVIGSTGGIGAALVEALQSQGDDVVALSRTSAPPIDLTNEASIEAAARSIGENLDLIIDATGFLSNGQSPPEKSFRQLSAAQLSHHFALNAIGPALLMKHFLPLLAVERRAVFATLSARLGSIEDNRLGGWFGYRASKAALNQFVRTASIELQRDNPQSICVTLHPGTVETKLSAPFARTGLTIQTPAEAAANILDVIDGLTPEDTGLFFDHRSKRIAF